MTLKMPADEITALLRRAFPEAGQRWEIIDLAEDEVTLRYRTDESMLRPGGTISGPSQMAVMDLAAYVMTLARVGPAELAVTSSLHMSFLRRPRPGVLVCTARLLKLGRSLAVIDALLCNEDADGARSAPVAHGELTYSLALVGGDAEVSG